jgi:hypothetical protein
VRAVVLVALVASACGEDDAADAGADAIPSDGAPAADGWEGFACGPSLWCNAGMACCDADPIYTCIDEDQTCGGDTWQCDGPEDCPTLGDGARCCSSGFGGQCLNELTPCTGMRLCHEPADCPSGDCDPEGFCR